MNLTWMVYLLAGVLASIGTGLLVYQKRRWSSWKNSRFRQSTYIEDWGKYPPIVWLTRMTEQRKKEKVDLELYEGISFLRNVVTIGKGAAISGDTLIAKLAEHGGLLSPAYAKMLRLLRQNQKEDAIVSFSNTAKTELSKDFARLLLQWDELDPKELTETLISHQKNIQEARITVQKRRDEWISDLIYLPVVVNVMLVFLNFIYVAYFLDQRQMLTMLM